MVALDYIVITVYFIVLVIIGLFCARKNKKQEDYFLIPLEKFWDF